MNDEAENTSKAGLQPGLTRATFIVSEKTLAEIKDIVFKDPERRTLKSHIAEALNDYIHKRHQEAIKNAEPDLLTLIDNCYAALDRVKARMKELEKALGEEDE